MFRIGLEVNLAPEIMSYNPAHWSSGTVESATPGSFLPEHYFILDQAKTALPEFHFSQPIHNPTNRPLVKVDGHCQLGAMDASLGPMDRPGYQLFFDGQSVNGPETKFWTLGTARDNCAWNLANNGSAYKIRCTYDGVVIGTNE